MIKKILALLIAWTLAFGLFPSAYAEEPEKEAVVNAGEIARSISGNETRFSVEFEKNSDLSLFNSQVPTIMSAPDRNGMALNKASSPSSIYFTFDGAIDKGLTLISFDYMIPEKGASSNLFYTRMLNTKFTGVNDENTNNMAELFWTEPGTGNAGFYPNSAGWTRGALTQIEFGKWHSVNIWLDQDLDKVYYTLDNTYLGTTGSNPSRIDGLHGINFSNTGASLWLDNISVTTIDRDTLKSISEAGVEIPEEMFTQYFMTAEIGGTGNVTFEEDAGKPIDAKITISSIASEDRELTLETTAKNESGHTYFSETRDVAVKADGDTETEITLPGVNKYGFYYLYSTLYNKTTGEVVGRDVTDFSLVRLPDAGTRNPKLGIENHIRHTRMGDPLVNLEFIDKAGFVSTRSEHAWQTYERAKKVYAMSDAYISHLNAKREKGIGHLEILAFNNPVYGSDLPPSTDATLKGFVDYALNFVKDTKERFGTENEFEVELWNEWNNIGPYFNADNQPPEVYAEFVKRVYPALKAAYPDLFVWGMSTIGVPSGDGAWLERVLAAGGGEYMDGISIHPYTNTSTPEGGGAVAAINNLKKLMEKYGIADKPLRGTEYGWPSVGERGYPDRMHQASYFVRMNVLNDANDLMERIDWYTINDGGESLDSAENHFGLLRGPDTHVPYGAKPSYLAATTWNDLMTGSEFVSSVQVGEDVAAYRYKLKDGRDCALVWKVEDGSESVGLNLGADSVTMVDMYGNEKPLCASNGSFQMVCDAMPIYLIGKFGAFEKAEPQFRFSADSINIPNNGAAALRIAQTDGAAAAVEISGSDDISIREQTGFSRGINKLVLESKGGGAELSDESAWDMGTRMNISTLSGSLELTLKDQSGSPVLYRALEISYSPQVSAEVSIKPKSLAQADKWETVFTLKNISYDKPASGIVKIESPVAAAGETLAFDSLKPGESQTLKLALPEGAIVDNKLSLKAEVSIENGDSYNIEQEITPNVCAHMETTPTIDGKLEPGEWNLNSSADLKDGNFVYIDGNPYGGETDLSGKLYMAWDDDNFYLGADITDDIFSDDKLQGGVLYRSDGIQFAMAPSRGSSTLAQFDIAKVGGVDLLQVDRHWDADMIGMLDTSKYELAIEREGTTTSYELRLPWSVIFGDDYMVEKNGELAMTFLVNENDGTVRRGYYEYGSGMGSGSANSSQYNSFYMLDKALIEELK